MLTALTIKIEETRLDHCVCGLRSMGIWLPMAPDKGPRPGHRLFTQGVSVRKTLSWRGAGGTMALNEAQLEKDRLKRAILTCWNIGALEPECTRLENGIIVQICTCTVVVLEAANASFLDSSRRRDDDDIVECKGIPTRMSQFFRQWTHLARCHKCPVSSPNYFCGSRCGARRVASHYAC